MKPELPEGPWEIVFAPPIDVWVVRQVSDNSLRPAFLAETESVAQALAAVLDLYPLLMRYYEAETRRAAAAFDSDPDWERLAGECDFAWQAVKDALTEAGDA